MSPKRFTLESTIYTHPGFLARRWQQIAVGIFLEETAAFDLTPPQYGLLAVARAYPGIDQISAGDKLGLDRTTVVDIAKRLARKGLVKQQTSRLDRRQRCIYLTASGRRRLERATPAVRRAQRRILDPLQKRQRLLLQRAIAQVVAHHNAASRVPLT